MKLSTLACMRVAGFATGVIAGALLSKIRWSTGTTVKERPLPSREPDQRTEAVTQEAMQTPDKQTPVKTSSKRQQRQETAAKPAPGLTKQQLYHEARKRNIRGRSTMTKAELERALR